MEVKPHRYKISPDSIYRPFSVSGKGLVASEPARRECLPLSGLGCARGAATVFTKRGVASSYLQHIYFLTQSYPMSTLIV